jgi:hypothetical protein
MKRTLTHNSQTTGNSSSPFFCLGRRQSAVGGTSGGGLPFFTPAQRNFLSAVVESLPVILLGAVCTLFFGCAKSVERGMASRAIDFRQPVAAMEGVTL